MNIIDIIKAELIELLAFFKKPESQFLNQSFTIKFRRLLIILCLDVIILTILTLLFYIVSIFGFDEIFKGNEIIEMFSLYPLWLLIILITFIIPLFEEFLFRFPLKYRRITINFLIPIIAFFISSYVIDIESLTLKVSLIIVCVSIFAFYVVKNNKINSFIGNLWSKKFGYVFYFSTFIFALTHLTNYKYSHLLIFIAPLLILPQFIGGFLIGYLRIRSGFLWGLALHITSNIILFLPFFIALSAAFPSFEIKTKDYDLIVRKIEIKMNPEEEFYFNSNDSIIIRNHSFKKILSLLINKPVNLIKFEDSYMSMGLPLIKSNILLDIKYYNKRDDFENKDVIFKSKQNILEEIEDTYGFILLNKGGFYSVEFN